MVYLNLSQISQLNLIGAANRFKIHIEDHHHFSLDLITLHKKIHTSSLFRTLTFDLRLFQVNKLSSKTCSSTQLVANGNQQTCRDSLYLLLLGSRKKTKTLMIARRRPSTVDSSLDCPPYSVIVDTPPCYSLRP